MLYCNTAIVAATRRACAGQGVQALGKRAGERRARGVRRRAAARRRRAGERGARGRAR